MHAIDVRSNASLAEVLSARAHQATPVRLLADISGGTALVLAMAVYQPRAWVVLASAGLCFSAYGVWALAERRLEWRTLYRSVAAERGWRTARMVSAVVGLGAFVTMLLASLMLILGTWIS